MTLRADLPLAIDWDVLKTQPPDREALLALCTECGFHGFRDELGPPPAAKREAGPPWVADYRLVDTPEAFAAFLDELARQPRFCLDTETTALDPLQADLVGLSFAWSEGVAYYLPVRGPEGSRHLDEATTLAALRPILEDTSVEKIGQNLKYDMLALARAGVEVAGPITDTMILSYLLESGERIHNLDQLSQRLLGHTMIPITDLIGKGKGQLRMDQVDVTRVAEYAGEDADATWRIEAILSPRVRAEGLWDLYADLERPLISVLARMERAGMAVDVARLRQLSEEFAGQMATMEEEIYKLAGRPFNINSPPQLRQILFDELKLPPLSKTPGGELSTAQDVLESLAPKHPLPALLIRHRQLGKLKGTYLDALPLLVHPGDNRIHASFNQGIAATGRLSSSDPNLQNIPVRSEEGRQIRQAFIPGEPGWLLLTADYSQIELRILAALLGRPGADAGLRRGPRHPPRRGRADLRRRGIRGRRGAASRGQDGQLRRDLRPEPLRPGGPAGDHPGGGHDFHRCLFPGIRGCRSVHHLVPRGGHGEGPRRDHPGPTPADRRHQDVDRAGPQPGRADGRQYHHPGLGGRPDQAGHAPDRPGASRPRIARADAAPDP